MLGNLFVKLSDTIKEHIWSVIDDAIINTMNYIYFAEIYFIMNPDNVVEQIDKNFLFVF
jgi:hypothetical protein